MIRWPWVSVRAYDVVAAQLELERGRTDRLLEQLVRLKRKGFELPRTGAVSAPPDPEQQALARVEERFIAKVRTNDREFVDAATQDLVDRGMSLSQARAEAARLRAAVTDMHPAGG